MLPHSRVCRVKSVSDYDTFDSLEDRGTKLTRCLESIERSLSESKYPMNFPVDSRNKYERVKSFLNSVPQLWNTLGGGEGEGQGGGGETSRGAR